MQRAGTTTSLLIAALVTSTVVGCGVLGGDDGNAGRDRSGPSSTSVPGPDIEVTRHDVSALDDPVTDSVDDVLAVDDLPTTAVGSAHVPGEGQRPMAWQDVDGTWRRIELPLPDGAAEATAGSIVGDGDRPLVVGATWIDGRSTVAAWTTGDSGRWHAVDVDVEDDGADEVWFSQVVRAGDRFVALGGTDSTDPGGERGVGVVWRSSDGRSWSRVSPVSDDPDDTVTAVTIGRDEIVAVGHHDDDGTRTPRAWWSDGDSWHEATFADDPDGWLGSVAATPAGFVAGGSAPWEANDGPAIWSSADGRTWSAPDTELPHRATGAAAAGGPSVDGFAVRDDLVVAYSSQGMFTEIWRRRGDRWQAWGGALGLIEGYDFGVDISALAIGADRVPLVITGDPTVLRSSGDTWVEEPGAAEAFALDGMRATINTMAPVDDQLAIGGEGWTVPRPGRSPTVAGSVWATRDGGLDHVHPPPFAGGFVSSLVQTDLGLVAAGFERFGRGRPDSDEPLAAVGRGPGAPVSWEPIPLEGVRGVETVARWRGGWLGVGLHLGHDESRTLGSTARGRILLGDAARPTAGVLALDGVEVAAEADQYVPDVCTGGLGAVARGWISGPGTARTMVAHSTDGRTWTPATADDGFAEGDDGLEVRSCAVSDGHGVLLQGSRTGEDDRRELLLWHSTDGLSWTALHDAPGLSDDLRDPSIDQVVAVDDGWVVVGVDHRGGRRVDLVAWHVTGDGDVVRLAMPAEVADGQVHAAWEACLWGDDLAVLGSEQGAATLWRIDLADLLATG